MLIGSDLYPTSSLQCHAVTSGTTRGAYAALALAAAAVAGSGSPVGTAAGTGGASGKKSGPSTEALLKELRDYIDKGPVVAMREKILKSMGLTEAELKALPPEKQAAIEDEIARRIKEMLLEQQEQAKTQQAATQKLLRCGALSGSGV